MKINPLKRKQHQQHRQGKKHYQTPDWKWKRDYIWVRDQGLCQICLKKDIIHPLVRGTKDMDKQGHVDHVIPLEAGGGDDTDNLQLVGARCHAVKSNKDRKYYR